jgi:hypothetical protein
MRENNNRQSTTAVLCDVTVVSRVAQGSSTVLSFVIWRMDGMDDG